MAGNYSGGGFLQDYVKDEVDCHYVGIEDFGAPIDNENNDVPLYDQYNRGLTACETGMNRKNLALEGQKRDKSQRSGLTGYIPSVEQAAQYQGTSPMNPNLIVALGQPSQDMMQHSLMRRGLTG